MSDRHPLFMPVIFGGGMLFGFGLAASHMARPEVVLNFPQFDDLGLVFVMVGAALVAGFVFEVLPRIRSQAPLTKENYGRRLKPYDRNVLIGGTIFGVGWGISGVCPGAGYASLGIGNLQILWAILGMFVGAYLQGVYRSHRMSEPPDQ